jgi:glutathione S-transferase
MKLYYAPLACSLASRIALYEAEASVEFVYVDIHTTPQTRLLLDGSDYYAINPMGQVPALSTPDGQLLTENPVVLQYIADAYPQSQLAPPGGMPRYRLQEWLNFIGTELHKGTYIPLLARESSEGAKEFARHKLPLRFGRLNSALKDREFLLEGFTVADAYLFTVLNWSTFAGVELTAWPGVTGYVQRLAHRPSVARAIAEETEGFAEERRRGPITPRPSGARSEVAPRVAA